MMNIIAVVVCTGCAIIQGIKGNGLLCVLDIALAAINVPLAIEWIK